MRLDEFREFLEGIKIRPIILYFQEIYHTPNMPSWLDMIGWYKGYKSTVTSVSLDGVFMRLGDASVDDFRFPFNKWNNGRVVSVNLHYCLDGVVGEVAAGVEDVREVFGSIGLERYCDLVGRIDAEMVE